MHELTALKQTLDTIQRNAVFWNMYRKQVNVLEIKLLQGVVLNYTYSLNLESKLTKFHYLR